MDFSNLMQGFYPTILGVLIGVLIPRLFQKNDNQKVKCDAHTDRIVELERRVALAENNIDGHDEEISETKKILVVIQNDIKTLLQRF